MKFDQLKEFSQPAAEQKVLAFWDTHHVFHQSHDQAVREKRPQFVFYEGPPTANGRPGTHHIIARTSKDIICRYKHMQGFRVDRKAGWDTHGLPVEIEVEKKLGLTSKKQVLEYGVAKFVQECQNSVFTYLEDWKKITSRMGYWLNLEEAYVTLHWQYIESVWWILKNLFDRDLLYKGYKTVPFCPRCGTGLSSHEVAQGYEMVKDPSLFVKMKSADSDFSYLVWTTTPWTLPSNAALCMRAEADYVMVEHEGEKLVLAEALVSKVFGTDKPALEKKKGSEFVKRKYIPLFDTFQDKSAEAFYLINGDFVTLEDGTGIVHIAPGYGQDDYEIGKQFGLPVLQAVEANGLFREGTGPYSGMFIKDADPIITKDLKIAGRLFKKEQYEHNYPFCWRCDSPLIYIARQSWYIRTTQFKEQLIKNNNAINWVPDEIRTGRMVNWLENNVDWALSRERFWGTPLPIWVCNSTPCQKMKAVGSLEELLPLLPLQPPVSPTSASARALAPDVVTRGDLDSLLSEQNITLRNLLLTNLVHKPQVDEIKLTCECGSTMTRVPELIDVWFDSGAMPYAQWHYPFENKDEFEAKYPADFISEAVDQTRGWFYSLLAISTLISDNLPEHLKNLPPFKNVIVLEFVLDKHGKKMSKHKGNVLDPFEMLDKYGADPVRWYLISMSNPWVPKSFDLEGLAEVSRKYFDTLRNTYSFFAIYANIDDILSRADKTGLTVDAFLESKAGDPDRFDRWIMSRYESLVKDVTDALDKYDITRPTRRIQQFVIDDLSNWYVRLNRRRFWAKADDPSKMRAYLTLYRILEGVCRLSAPVSPFIAELLWTELSGPNREKRNLSLSVHMASFPKPETALIDSALDEVMETVRQVVSLGRAARSRKNLKVRQPLSTLMVGLPKQADFARISEYLGIIQDELNIKEVKFAADLGGYVRYSAKLNFKTAGPKLGPHVKAAQTHLTTVDNETIKKLVTEGKISFMSDGQSVNLTTDEVDIQRIERDGYAVESDGPVTIALVTALTQELIDEGFAREMVNKIQNMRKSSGFDVTDMICVKLSGTKPLNDAVSRHREFIKSETLARELEFIETESLNGGTEWNINGEKAAIAVAKL